MIVLLPLLGVELGELIGSDETSTSSAACVGADESEVTRRAAAIGRPPDELRTNGVAGTVEQAAEKLSALEDEGVTRVYLQVLDLDDLDHLRVLAQLL